MTRFRKATTAILKEGQRRSPRICALESNAVSASANNNNNDNNGSKNGAVCMRRRRGQGGSAFQTRARKRTKLKPLQQLATNNSSSPPNQVEEDVTHSHHQAIQNKTGDQPSQLPSTTFVPEKRILQLFLDTLQRRDTYEIFAEPVDPNEVENYYEIIEEPMDFGTMRAKLHEGMYKSLEQFEHDVFLIFNNAMHFNSAGTVYFRQARAISEVAKKVFDLLRSDPEKFEMEFSETRRKVGRRNQGDFRDTTDMKSSEITIGVPSKTAPSSSRGTSNRKSLKANHGCSEIPKHVDARDLELPTGTKENSRYKFVEVDRRCTYRALSLGEDESTFPTVYGKLKQLEYVNQQDVGYRDSLMLFVKDLGASVQNIAKRKLLGCEIHTASTLNRSGNHLSEMKNTIDLSGGKAAYMNDKSMMMLLEKSKLNNEEGVLVGNVDKLEANNVLKWRLERKLNSESGRKEIGWSSEGMKKLKSEESVSVGSSFVLNMPYLRTRLDRMNRDPLH